MKRVRIFYITTIALTIFLAVCSAYALEVTISDGVPGPTVRIAATDTATALSSGLLTKDGVAIKGAIISVEGYAVRVAFGGTSPTQGASPVGHTIASGGSARFYGYTALRYMKYINATNGSTGVMQFTPLY